MGKVQSRGSRLGLVNFVLYALPSYMMSYYLPFLGQEEV